MAPRDVLLSRQPALTGRRITSEERGLLEAEFSGDFEVAWLLDLMSEFPLAGTTFTLDEDQDRSELGAEMKWLDAEGIRSEARDLYPGREVVARGYLPIGECLLGSGDPYFLKLSDGNNPPIVRIPHDNPDEVEVVQPTLEDFLRIAAVE